MSKKNKKIDSSHEEYFADNLDKLIHRLDEFNDFINGKTKLTENEIVLLRKKCNDYLKQNELINSRNKLLEDKIKEYIILPEVPREWQVEKEALNDKIKSLKERCSIWESNDLLGLIKENESLKLELNAIRNKLSYLEGRKDQFIISKG